MTSARHARGALAWPVALAATLAMLSAATAGTSPHVDQALLDPEGAFSYPPDENDRQTILAEDTVLARMLRVNDALRYPKAAARIRANVMGELVGAVETSNAAIVQSLNQLLARPAVFAAARGVCRGPRGSRQGE